MDRLDRLRSVSQWAVVAGAGAVVVPTFAAGAVACSRAIFVNIIANTIVRVLTANRVKVDVYGIRAVPAPRMWKFAKYSALTGAALIALGTLGLLAHWRLDPNARKERFFNHYWP